MQPASSAQLVPHAFPEHWYGAHNVAFPLLHTPNPSHEYPVWVPFAQVVVPHSVPGAQSLHAPLPSQLPLSWQVGAAAAAHSLSGSVSALTEPHTPSAPAPFFTALHAWHWPLQGESQQNPSAQLPLAHCVPSVQEAPLAWSGLHAPVAMSQYEVATHCVSSLQVERQAVVPQVYGAHEVVLPLLHTPNPSHE
jgi:hypothetical protein